MKMDIGLSICHETIYRLSKIEITNIQDKLNHRSRKVLNYRIPYEVFFKEFALLD